MKNNIFSYSVCDETVRKKNQRERASCRNRNGLTRYNPKAGVSVSWLHFRGQVLPSCCIHGTDVKRVNVCVKFFHSTIVNDPTGSLAYDNSTSLYSVVKARNNLPTRLQFDDYLFVSSWNEIIDVWKCVFLYRPVEYNSVLYMSSVVRNSCNLSECRFLTVIESVNFFVDWSKKRIGFGFLYQFHVENNFKNFD